METRWNEGVEEGKKVGRGKRGEEDKDLGRRREEREREKGEAGQRDGKGERVKGRKEGKLVGIGRDEGKRGGEKLRREKERKETERK